MLVSVNPNDNIRFANKYGVQRLQQDSTKRLVAFITTVLSIVRKAEAFAALDAAPGRAIHYHTFRWIHFVDHP
jgi:hypothetical protein